MALAQYCHVVDVLRKFNPQLTETNLDNDDYIGYEDREQVRARIDAVSDDFDDQTRSPLRLVRTGSPGAPETYEHVGVEGSGKRAPLRASLAHRNVVPFDADAGDALEVRTSRDGWRDVTSLAGSKYTLDHRSGRLRLYNRLTNWIYWDVPDDRYIRATYRHGALGGSRTDGGQTTLSSQAAQGATSLSVQNAARLPSSGVLLVGNDEYVRATSVDYGTDTVTVERGIRATTDQDHSSGAVVHYCPLNVRDAVAAKTARELLRYEDWVDELAFADASQQIGASEKAESWQDAYDSALAKHSAVRQL